MSSQLCYQGVSAFLPHKLLWERGRGTPSCRAERSDRGGFRKSGTLELVSLKKAEGNWPN